MMIAAGAAGTGTFKAEIKLKSIVIRIQESILKTQVIQKNVKDIFQKKKHYSESDTKHKNVALQITIIMVPKLVSYMNFTS